MNGRALLLSIILVVVLALSGRRALGQAANDGDTSAPPDAGADVVGQTPPPTETPRVPSLAPDASDAGGRLAPPAGDAHEATGSLTFHAAPQAPPESAEEPQTPRPKTMEEVSDAATHEMRVSGLKSRYSFNFFGETSLSVGHPTAPDRQLSFGFGPQDFLLKGELGGHLVATTEFNLEVGDQTTLDLERLHVRWQTTQFFVEAGRVHTAFGYWNNAYHHGSWLQPAIERPRWVAFEDDGGVLPVHWVGLDLGAHLNTGSGSLNLTASIGNSRGKIVDDVRNDRDYNSRKAVHASVEYVGLIWPDLRVGVSGIYGRIPAQPALVRPALPDAPIDEWIGGAHIAYPSVPLILIVEAYLVSHRHASQDFLTYGGFALLGYAFGPLAPYVEYERFASRGGKDPFFIPDPVRDTTTSLDTSEVIGGLRLDLTDWSALKVEYRNTRVVDQSSTIQEGVLDWSWGF